jgi:hypothetical protein
MREAPEEEAQTAVTDVQEQALRLSETVQLPTVGQSFDSADRALHELISFSGRLELPEEGLEQQDAESLMDSPQLVAMRQVVAAGMQEVAASVNANPELNRGLFFPNRIPESLFERDTVPPLRVVPMSTGFRRFIAGQAQSFRGSGEETVAWLNEHREQYEQAGLRLTVRGNNFTITNTRYNRSFAKGVLVGEAFDSFMDGSRPEFSGSGRAQARWLAENRQALEDSGIAVQIEGNRYLLHNTEFQERPLDPTIFEGSGLSGQNFSSFIDGISPAYSTRNSNVAQWLSNHEAELARGNMLVNLERNSRGDLTGRFTIYNLALLPPNITPEQRSVLSRTMAEARIEMGIAERTFEYAKTRRSQARTYMTAALLHFQNASDMYRAVVSYTESSRLIHARRREISALPSNERREVRSLLLNATAYIAQAGRERGDQKIDSIRRATFLVQMAEARLFIRRSSSQLSSQEVSNANAYLDRAMQLFDEQSEESLERASFILGHIHSLVTYSLERAAVGQVNAATSRRTVYVNVERMPMFQTNGTFNPRKFRQLTGVSYDDYRNGTPESRRGLASILCANYRDSIRHYDTAIGTLHSLIGYASTHEDPDRETIGTLRSAAFREHELGSLSFARTAQFDRIFSSATQLSRIVRRLPSEQNIQDLNLGTEGREELTESRNQMLRARSRVRRQLCNTFFSLLAAQNSPNETARSTHLANAQRSATAAERADQSFTRRANEYNQMYSYTSAVVTHINSLVRSAASVSQRSSEMLFLTREALGSLRDSPQLARDYFVRVLTDPSFLPQIPLPRREQFMKYVNALGTDNFAALYRTDASDEQVTSAADALLNTRIEVTVMRDSGHPEYHKPIRSRETRRLEDLLTGDAGSSVLSPAVFESQWLRSENRQLLVRLRSLRDNPRQFTTAQRREIILGVLRALGRPETLRAFRSIESSISDVQRRYIDAHLEQLDERIEGLPEELRSMTGNASLLIRGLRPSQITAGSNGNIILGDSTLESDLQSLAQQSHAIVSIPAQMFTYIPRIATGMEPIARDVAIQVGRAEVDYQARLDEQASRRRWIVGGAIVGGVIAAPFTAGQSFWGTVGIIGVGAGIGMSIPSVTFATQDYYRVANNPDATDEQISQARNRMWREIGLSATLVLPAVGHATRAWAIGRGALNLARAGYAAEIVGGLGMMGYGALHTYEGIEMIGEGRTGWGAFNVGMGALLVVGGGALTFSGASRWRALGRLGREGIAPQAVARNIAVLSESGDDLARIAVGGENTLSAQQLARVHSAARNIRDYVTAGGRLSVQEAQAYNVYRSIMQVQPARDVRTIRSFYSNVRNGRIVSSNSLADAVAARRRLQSLAQLRELSAAETRALSRATTAISRVAARDASRVAEFNSAAFSGRSASAIEAASARTSFERLELLELEGSITSEQLATLNQYRQVARSQSGGLSLLAPDEVSAIRADLATAIADPLNPVATGRIQQINIVGGSPTDPYRVYRISVQRPNGSTMEFIYSNRSFRQEELGITIYRSAGEVTNDFILLEPGNPNSHALQQIVGEADLRTLFMDFGSLTPAQRNALGLGSELTSAQRMELLRDLGRQGAIDYALGIPDSHTRNFRVVNADGHLRVIRIDFENGGMGWGRGLTPNPEAVVGRDHIVFWETFRTQMIGGRAGFRPGEFRAFVRGINDGIAEVQNMNPARISRSVERFWGTAYSRTGGRHGPVPYAFDDATHTALRQRLTAIANDPAQARFDMLDRSFNAWREALVKGNGRFVDEFLDVMTQQLRTAPDNVLINYRTTIGGALARGPTTRVRAGMEDFMRLLESEFKRRGLPIPRH